MVAEESPFSQNTLVSSECFILDNGANGHIFIWKGEHNRCETSKTHLTGRELVMERERSFFTCE